MTQTSKISYVYNMHLPTWINNGNMGYTHAISPSRHMAIFWYTIHPYGIGMFLGQLGKVWGGGLCHVFSSHYMT
jgi:hypothetical protein